MNNFSYTDPACVRQDDYYDSDDVYVKTICTIEEKLNWQKSALRCGYIDAQIADAHNTPDAESILIARIAYEYRQIFDARSLWIGTSSSGGQCSVVTSASPSYFVENHLCTDSAYSYCEFNSELSFKIFDEIFSILFRNLNINRN
jgi:hypothetical protein